MLKLIRKLIDKIASDIDSGNSNINEDEAIEIIDTIKKVSDKTERLSKYQSCKYLNVSRPTFDNYIREGKLPKGKKQAGFKELSWEKRDLDKFIKKYRNDNTKNRK